MASKGVNIKIEANTKQAAQGIDKVTEQLNNMAKESSKGLSKFAKLGSAVSGLQASFSMVTGAMKAAKDAVMDCVNAYQTQANAETQLETAVKNNPYLRDESVQKLKDYASQLQSIGTVGDETLIPLMAQLVSSGRSEAETMEIMSAALDASASGAISLESAVTSLSKSYSGEAGELSKLNPKVKELTKDQLKGGEAVKLIADSYKGMAENTANATGGFQKLKNSWGDFLEVLGKPINAILNPIALGFSGFVDKIAGFFKKLNDKWDDFVKKISGSNLPTADEIDFEVKDDDIKKAQAEVKRLQEIVNSTDTKAGAKAVEEFSDSLDDLGDNSEETAKKTLRAFESFRNLEDSLKVAEDAKQKLDDIVNGASAKKILQDAEKNNRKLYDFLTLRGLRKNSSADDVKKIMSDVEKIITAKTNEIDEQVKRTVAGGVKGAAVSAVDTGELDKVEQDLIKAQKNLTALQEAKAKQDKERRDKEAQELKDAQDKELTQTQDFINKQIAVVTNGEDLQNQKIKDGMQDSFDWDSYASSVLTAYTAIYTEMGTLAYDGSKKEVQKALALLKSYYEKAQKELGSSSSEFKDWYENELAEAVQSDIDSVLDDATLGIERQIEILEALKEAWSLNEDAVKALDEALKGLKDTQKETAESWDSMSAMDRFNFLEEQGQKLASSISDAFSMAGEYMDNELSASLSDLEIQFNKGLMSEEEYNEKKEEIEKDAAKKKYKIQLAEWGLNLLATQSAQALAIANSLSKGGVIGMIEAAVTGAAAAVQLAAQIAAKPVPPSYATGGVVGGFSGASVGGDDTYIHARSGEMMLNAAQQRNLYDIANSRGSGGNGGLNVEIKNYKGNDTGVSAQMDNGTLKIIVDSIVKDSMGNGEYNSSLRSAQNTMQGVKYTS